MATLSQLVDRVSGGRITKRDFESRIDRYVADGQRADGDGESLVDAFLKSGGEWLTEASARIAQTQPMYDFDRATDVLGLWREPGSFDRALAQLTKDGYAILDVRVPDATVAELSDYFADAPCTLTSDSGSSLSAGETVRVDFESPLAEKYAVTTDAVLQNATVRALLLDRGLLQIAQAYCGSAPIVDIVTAWYSFPSAHASHEAAQLYHFDLDRVRWLKAFLLLTDQDDETGAHMYVPGSQADHGISKELLARGYARLEDAEVDSITPAVIVEDDGRRGRCRAPRGHARTAQGHAPATRPSAHAAVRVRAVAVRSSRLARDGVDLHESTIRTGTTCNRPTRGCSTRYVASCRALSARRVTSRAAIRVARRTGRSHVHDIERPTRER